jgi:tetratricopeptide (TPR) repeat protein
VSGRPQSGDYPGNLSLPIEVRQKILSTFRHTLDLYRDGKLDDCLIGCDFILKMDPRFAPARKLQEKAHNPKADVDLSELEAVVSPAGEPAAAATTPRETAAARVLGRETGPVRPSDLVAPPLPRETRPPASSVDAGGPPPLEGLEELSLDSLSLDAPLPDLMSSPAGFEAGLPFEPTATEAASAFADLLAAEPELPTAEKTSPEEEIAVLLGRGDDARAAGDRQQAIEIWSRIFLIDINNAEAVTRIDRTRHEMAEESRRVAAALEKGQESFAKGGLAAAKSQFDAVLGVENEPPRPAPRPSPVASKPVPEALPPHDLSIVAAPGDVLAEELEQSGPPGRRSWTAIPRPSRETAPGVEGPAAEAAKRPAIRLNARVAILGGAILAVVGTGIFFLLRSSGGNSERASVESGATLEHATQLFREGKIAETTAELQKIPRGHPDYARAQKLLASLGAPAPPAAPPSAASAPAAVAPASESNPAGLRADGERALAEKRYIDAMKSFSLAAPHFQGDPTFAQEMAAASEKVSELTPAVKLYNDGEYETAIPMLWRIYQGSRDNQDARSYLLRAYYNQGIAQLQNGNYDRAKEAFSEVLTLDPADVDAARHRQFAERYRTGEVDLLGRIYVRYISPRP